MALTKHQLAHINAVIRDAKDEGNEKALIEAQKILKNGIFPTNMRAGEEDYPSHIHRYLEENEDGEKWQTLM